MRWVLRQDHPQNRGLHEGRDLPLDDFEAYQRKILRHEVLHAFMFESGLDCNIYHPSGQVGGHEEQMVDWFAVQYPKIRRVYEELGIGE